MIVELIKNNYDASIAVMLFLSITLAYLISLTFHEYAHAFIAYKQGDDTAKLSGRLTLNPFAHMDFWGFVCFLFAGFGWAKPVPVNPLKFKKYKTGIARVSLAGVSANLILCFVFSAFYVLSMKFFDGSWISQFLTMFCYYTMSINAWLIFLNILPIYPLDGFNWLSTKLKPNSKFIEFNVKYGQFVLLALMLSQVLIYYISFCSSILTTPFVRLFTWMFGL